MIARARTVWSRRHRECVRVRVRRIARKRVSERARRRVREMSDRENESSRVRDGLE